MASPKMQTQTYSGHYRNFLLCKSLAEEVILWTEDSYFSHKQRLEFKPSDLYICFLHSTYNFSLQKMLNDVEYCDVFYQTLILTAPIHCRASIADTLMQCYISPNLFP